MTQVRVELGIYVPLTSAMASVSGTPAYGNSVFIPEAHALTLAKCKDYNPKQSADFSWSSLTT
jgi:hypothetical protein